MRTPLVDLHITAGSFELDDTIGTAINISLLSYARAQPGDPIPDGAYTHGWWGDQYSPVEGDSFGSRLWTLTGLSPAEIADRAPALAEAALQWLIDDGILTAVDASAEILPSGVSLVIEVS
jgi:phage gp46-like protein